jgi:glycosyltransferase involved in cell wall biosynthesis
VIVPDLDRQSPLVSVVVPTYGRPRYLAQALESALAQTYRHVEIIVTDNGPSEEVERLVASYRDPRLRYRHNGGNVGLARNALAGYREVRGEYIATLHDDDSWEPTFLAQLLPPLIANPDLTLSFCDHWIIGADGVIDERASLDTTRRWRRDRLREGILRPFFRLALVHRGVPILASVLRRSAIDWTDFPEGIGLLYDVWLGYLASRQGRGAYYRPERLMRYRLHAGSSTNQIYGDRDRWAQQAASHVFCYQRFVEDDGLRSIRGPLEGVRAWWQTRLGIALLEQGRRREGRRHLVRGLLRRPEMLGMLALLLSTVPVGMERIMEQARLTRWRLGRGATLLRGDRGAVNVNGP